MIEFNLLVNSDSFTRYHAHFFIHETYKHLLFFKFKIRFVFGIFHKFAILDAVQIASE